MPIASILYTKCLLIILRLKRLRDFGRKGKFNRELIVSRNVFINNY